MTQGDIIAIMSDAVSTILKVSLPMLGGGLLIGLLISIFQATTQINEQTLAFVPKLITILLILVFTFGWIMTQMNEFMTRVFAFMANVI